MILEEETFEAFGYYPSDLSPQSHKPILAACDECGIVRETNKNRYRALCFSCGKKGNTNGLGYIHTEASKALMRAAAKGKTLTEGHKALISVALKGRTFTEAHKANLSGENNHSYNGGKKVANARHTAKRRELGFIALNAPFEGCEGHHITHTFIIYVPKALNRSVYHNINTGQGMLKINALALEFLINGF